MNGRVLAAFAGFLILGLSPSFIDWQQSPDKRTQMVLYYAAAFTLLYIGLFNG